MDVERYWIVDFKAYAFDTEEQAREFQDKLIDAFTAMPEAEGFGASSTIREEVEATT
ncbi:hypothetical protein [uncultured Ruegeria sp.]|uniref:hypothetical protein n=1 Tax=uncultured Ruegeria sp. TaxID=259304 RepID=UPI0026039297|nr:hypothetical protein [uncultured Ruegeria sp.]